MFDKAYYEDIWETVHRHDYCNTLADNLITKFGKVRFLDVGCGCGFLVKTLRDKGCEAYGMEISQYAVDNSHGNVLLSSVTDIPFKDNYFDVVFSQGLWDYIKEEDIDQAWKECLRVGRHQEHYIDTTQDTGPWSKDFLTHKSQEWWDNKLKQSKILVACPNHSCKEYAFQQWLDNVNNLTFKNIDILVIDNSPDDSFLNRWKDKVNIRRIDTTGIEDYTTMRINYSYEEIRKEFLSKDYDRLMIIESDIITPPDVIEKMLLWGKDTDWISHAYPTRGQLVDQEQGIGCSLFTRRLMEAYNFYDFGDNYSTDGGLWNLVRPDRRFRTMELWSYWENKHLKEPENG